MYNTCNICGLTFPAMHTTDDICDRCLQNKEDDADDMSMVSILGAGELDSLVDSLLDENSSFNGFGGGDSGGGGASESW